MTCAKQIAPPGNTLGSFISKTGRKEPTAASGGLPDFCRRSFFAIVAARLLLALAVSAVGALVAAPFEDYRVLSAVRARPSLHQRRGRLLRHPPRDQHLQCLGDRVWDRQQLHALVPGHVLAPDPLQHLHDVLDVSAMLQVEADEPPYGLGVRLLVSAQHAQGDEEL